MSITEIIARAVASDLRLEWHGHDHASINPRSVQDAAAAAITALEAAGYVIVPKEPTEAMLKVGCQSIEMAETPDIGPDDPSYFWGCSWRNEAKEAYRAMIQAGREGA